jgi:hypothetical protein
MQFLEYQQQQEEKIKLYDIYYLLADEFHYQNENSIRNVVKKVKEIVKGEVVKG